MVVAFAAGAFEDFADDAQAGVARGGCFGGGLDFGF